MKKKEKIIVGILLLVLIMMIGILFFTKTDIKKRIETNIGNQSGNLVQINHDEEIGRIVKVDGTLYYDTGRKSNELRCGMMDGKIELNVEKDQIPTEDNQSNFEGEYNYQFWGNNEIQILINNEWCVFEAKGYSFCGVIKQVEEKCFFVEPDQDEEIRQSANLIMVGINSENIYKVGDKVKITYDGYVMETYPAQIRAINIEIKEKEEFELKVYDKQPETNTKIHTILDKSEFNKYNYNIYSYEVNVNIVIAGEEISLRKALLEDKITMDEIIQKADKEIPDAVVYKDGGSKAYQYEGYTIIKLHRYMNSENINEDVYIGMSDFNINDL